MPATSDGRISRQTLQVHDKEWTVYAVGGSPAQTVQHAILEIITGKPDLVVSGINYGLNLGTGVTISGTVGAAMEGAAHGIPSLAISLDTDKQYHLSHSREIDFQTAAHFTRYFAGRLLAGGFDTAVQILKVEVPHGASPDTPWEVARLATARYYVPQVPPRGGPDEPQSLGYTMETDLSLFPRDSDVFVVLGKKRVAVTPLTLDMTAPVDLETLAARLADAQA